MAKASYLLELVIGAKQDPSFQRNLVGTTYGINNIANFTSKATKVMAGAFAAAGGAALAFAVNAQQTYKEFESAIAKTSAIANATVQQEAAMEEAARYAGRTTTMTATQSAEALGYMALAGWSVNDSTRALLPVLRLAEATQADLQTTSDLVTDSMGALGLSIDDLNVYMDKLVATNNNANTTAEWLMESLIKTGGASKTLGVSLDDTITAVGVLASSGFKAEEAGTALNSIFTRIGANPEAAKGLKSLGVSIYDANGNFIGLRKSLIAINQAMQGMSDQESMTALRLIAGTRRVSQFQYLLDAVGTTAEKTTSQWDTLEQHVENSTGSLDVMNERVTDTMAAAEERLVSAWNDLKIGFSDTYGDYWKDMLDGLAHTIPEITDRIEEFGRTHRREIKAFVNGIGDFLAGGANKLFDLITFVIQNKEGVLGLITGTVTGLTSINGLTKFLQFQANLSLVGPQLAGLVKHFGLLGLAIGGVVGGVVAIAGAIERAHEEAIRANLAEHFGDIALSMEEIERVAQALAYGDQYGLFKAFGTATEQLEQFQSAIDRTQEELDKYDWKIRIGLGLGEEDAENYKTAIAELVKNTQSYVDEQHYQITLAYNILFGESASEAVAGVDHFYAGQAEELEKLGQQLQEEVNKGFEDGLLEIDEQKKIRELQEQIESIQKGLADAQYQAKLDILESEYGGKNLDADSYQSLIEEVGNTTQEKIDQLKEAQMAALTELEYEKNNGLEYSKYIRRKENINDAYLQQAAETSSSSTAWLVNQAYSAYADEIGLKPDQLNRTYSQIIKEYMSGEKGLTQAMADANLPELGYKERDAIQRLLDEMQPQKEQLFDIYNELQEAGEKIPEAVLNAMNEIDNLETLASGEKFGERFWDMFAREVLQNPAYQEVLKVAVEQGKGIPQDLKAALERNTGMISGAADTLYGDTADFLKAVFAKGFDVDAAINLNPIATWTNGTGQVRGVYEGGGSTRGYRFTGSNATTKGYDSGVREGGGSTKGYKYNGSIKSNALGGIYNSEILTTAAEDGPEAIIPLDGSSRAQALWAEAGRRMGLIGSRDTALVQSMNAGAMSTTDNSSHNFYFSPQISVSGNANAEDVRNAVRMSFGEFKVMMEKYNRENQRVSFA